ncbi:MAG: hypothetical protein BZ137_01425 [Methanosphaera sp. rholeuAM130]|nr:MAG: hypothetical protein BZ137_01425 [Methanosphaera sp. rholeuAM130]
MAEKNMIIAVILSLIITGLGNVYNGLITRGAVEFVIGLVLGLLGMYVSIIFSIIGIVWALYVIYDTYLCTNAINNNQAIPLLLTQIDLQ